jgi:hypothetical protein
LLIAEYFHLREGYLWRYGPLPPFRDWQRSTILAVLDRDRHAALHCTALHCFAVLPISKGCPSSLSPSLTLSLPVSLPHTLSLSLSLSLSHTHTHSLFLSHTLSLGEINDSLAGRVRLTDEFVKSFLSVVELHSPLIVILGDHPPKDTARW